MSLLTKSLLPHNTASGADLCPILLMYLICSEVQGVSACAHPLACGQGRRGLRARQLGLRRGRRRWARLQVHRLHQRLLQHVHVPLDAQLLRLHRQGLGLQGLRARHAAPPQACQAGKQLQHTLGYRQARVHRQHTLAAA